MRALLFLLASVASLAPPGLAQARAGDDPKPDLALSAAFAPPRYVVRDPVQRERLRNYLRGLERDSSQTFSLDGDALRLSHRLAHRLHALENPDEVGADDGSDRFRARRGALARLKRMAGSGAGVIEEDAPAFAIAAEYRPDDFSLQTTPLWGLHNDGSLGGSVPGVDMNMPRVWERFDGADTLVIAVLDAGINFDHPDLQGRWFVNAAEAGGIPGFDDDLNGYVDDSVGWDFVDDDNDPHDFHSHGTQISGIIAANSDNGIGIAGVLPRVRILPVRVLSTAGFGGTADIAAGIRYAAAMGAHVLNFSIGVGGTTVSQTLRNAFIVARDSGMIIAAASANDGANLDAATTQPASYGFDNVYLVASHTAAGGLSAFSNYGATKVDLAAPGEYIATTTIPPALELTRETFEKADSVRWSFTTGSFQVAADTLEGAKSLRWVSGNLVDATLLDTVKMRARRGGVLRFRLVFQPATSGRDGLYIDVQRKGSPTWTEVGGYTSAAVGQAVAINLGAVDDTLFRIRFQTCAMNSLGNCSASTAGRVLSIDDIRIQYADENPANQAQYEQLGGGTSLAAPYFAGYAGLMRLATDRTSQPLTRARMLAGTVAEPALAGKLITGGRLDAAKGLDFYLRTLPRLLIADSTQTSWNPGASVAYSLTVADSAGPRADYAVSLISAPPGGTLSGGLFTWSSGTAPQGNYVLRAKAVKGPNTLRAMMVFGLGVPVGVTAAAPTQPSLLRVGNRTFLLPSSVFATSGRRQHELRLEVYGADGKTVQEVSGALSIPSGGRMAEYDLRGFRGVGMRAWLNGVALRPAARD